MLASRVTLELIARQVRAWDSQAFKSVTYIQYIIIIVTYVNFSKEGAKSEKVHQVEPRIKNLYL